MLEDPRMLKSYTKGWGFQAGQWWQCKACCPAEDPRVFLGRGAPALLFAIVPILCWRQKEWRRIVLFQWLLNCVSQILGHILGMCDDVSLANWTRQWKFVEMCWYVLFDLCWYKYLKSELQPSPKSKTLLFASSAVAGNATTQFKVGSSTLTATKSPGLNPTDLVNLAYTG